VHRPRINWERAERRLQRGTVEQRIFDGLKKLIAVRKSIPVFADFNNRELLAVDNEHLFVFFRSHPERSNEAVLVVANFDANPQYLDLTNLGNRGQFSYGQLQDLASGESPALFKDQLVVPPYRFYWLTDQPIGAV
jgi:amylosucrase